MDCRFCGRHVEDGAGRIYDNGEPYHASCGAETARRVNAGDCAYCGELPVSEHVDNWPACDRCRSECRLAGRIPYRNYPEVF